MARPRPAALAASLAPLLILATASNVAAPWNHHGLGAAAASDDGHETGGGGFVGVDGTQFVVGGGKTIYFSGFNAYWLMLVASDPARRGQVDHGLNLARTWAFNDTPLQSSPGVYDEAMFQGLDFVVAEARRHGIYLLLCLVNNFHDFGGKRQYVAWARDAGHGELATADHFFNSTVVKGYYKNHVELSCRLIAVYTIHAAAHGADAGEHRDRGGVQGRPHHPRLGAHERAAMRRQPHRRHGPGLGGGDGAVREGHRRRAPGDGGAGGLLRRRRAREQGPQPLGHLLRHQLRQDPPRRRRRLRHHPPLPGRLALGLRRRRAARLPPQLDALARPGHGALPRQAAARHRVRQVPLGARRQPHAAEPLPRPRARLHLRLGGRRRAARRRRLLAAARPRHGHAQGRLRDHTPRGPQRRHHHRQPLAPAGGAQRPGRRGHSPAEDAAECA